MTQRARLPSLERSGRPEFDALEGNVQRMLDQQYEDMRGIEEGAVRYSAANAADWSGSAPATIAEALDRLAAFVGPVP